MWSVPITQEMYKNADTIPLSNSVWSRKSVDILAKIVEAVCDKHRPTPWERRRENAYASALLKEIDSVRYLFFTRLCPITSVKFMPPPALANGFWRPAGSPPNGLWRPVGPPPNGLWRPAAQRPPPANGGLPASMSPANMKSWNRHFPQLEHK